MGALLRIGRNPVLIALLAAIMIVGSGCGGEDGADGTSCTVTDAGEGSVTITCDDGTSVTVNDGAAGAAGEAGTAGAAGAAGGAGDDGDACVVGDNDDGTYTITCGEDTVVTLSDGEDVDPAIVEGLLAELDEASNVLPESCSVCHGREGDAHQARYDNYVDTSELELEILSVVSESDGDGGFDSVLTFRVTKNGLPFADVDGMPRAGQKRFYAVEYDSENMTFDNSVDYIGYRGDPEGDPQATDEIGVFTVTRAGAAIAPEDSNAVVYGYVAEGRIDGLGSHYSLFDNVASAAVTFGTAATVEYESPANVDGCEQCHGEPYLKHGYRAAEVDGLGDFAACKTCHYDTREGGHEDWQMLVDDPARYAETGGDTDEWTAEELAQYAYTANVMNDVHMSHAMEFPYPQSIATCATCHEGKLDDVLVDENFVRETCVSCHPVTGDADYGTAALALVNITPDGHDLDSNCVGCHYDGGMAEDVRLQDLHNGGYDPMIYTEGGALRYSEVFTVSIDAASFAAATNILTVEFSATEVGGEAAVADFDADDIVPTLLIGPYGYDTKDFIVAPHGRDDDRNRLLEFVVGGTNPRFTTVTAAAGAWEVDVDMTMWADMIGEDLSIRRAEIAVLPGLTVVVGDEDVSTGECDPGCSHGFYCSDDDECVEENDWMLAVNAPSRTFDLIANDFDDDYYEDITEVDGCNDCHDALATSFHSGDRGGNITVCRLCHVGLSGGSHLELQSRSIDSYVHAVHSFQAFDPGDIDFEDEVEALRYEHHIEHTFPNFTRTNCEACHNEGAYNVPDQSRSMPGLLSGTDDVEGRNIGDIPEVVTGPGARACGGCHRAEWINEDDAAGLAAFYQHMDINGYVVENDGDDVALYTIIETIMSMFSNR